jgi:hypothetical protein
MAILTDELKMVVDDSSSRRFSTPAITLPRLRPGV